MSSEKKPERKKPGSKSASVTANLDAKKEDISRIVSESVQYFPREPVKTNEECAERLNDYFAQCCRTGQIPTVEDMCLALGVTRQTVWEWENGKRGANQERRDMIKKAKEILAAIDAKLVTEGKIPQVTYIFRAKNFFGMKDQQEVVLTPNNPLGDAEDSKALKDKYLENTYGVTPELAESSAEALKIEQKAAEGAESTDNNRLAVTTSKN